MRSTVSEALFSSRVICVRALVAAVTGSAAARMTASAHGRQ
ncbi:MAG TPA: hypothetical protein VFE59_32185 [Trebonia sp.]|nr:hypothetical protein [Trebonia sp.]